MNFAQSIIDKVLYKKIDSSGTGARVNKTSELKHAKITLTESLNDNEVMFFIPKVSGKMKVSVTIAVPGRSVALDAKVSVTRAIYKNETLLETKTQTDYLGSNETVTYSFPQAISVEAFSRYRVEFVVSIIQDSHYSDNLEFDYSAEVEGFISDKPDLYIL